LEKRIGDVKISRLVRPVRWTGFEVNEDGFMKPHIKWPDKPLDRRPINGNKRVDKALPINPKAGDTTRKS